MQKGYVYVAPTDHHLIIDGEQIRISRGPKENNFRPAIDVLFRSAAHSCGSRVVGVVLTGVLDDGSAGLLAIKSRGGKAVVQDPDDAMFADMPKNALKVVEADYCLPVNEMGGLLVSMANESAEEKEYPASDAMELEVKIALEDNAMEQGVMSLGLLTSYTCPECHGALAQIQEGRLTRFRCHTGHAYSLNTLLVEVTKSIDHSLWDTVRTIEESQLLLNHLASHLREAEEQETADIVLQKAEEAKARAKAIRELVINSEILSQEKLSYDYNRKVQ
jgi:two-component system chemotaxis response regulator CheB